MSVFIDRESTPESLPVITQQRALEALLFVGRRENEIPRILFILFSANLDHLSGFGRMIVDDTYWVTQEGPLATLTEKILKVAAGNIVGEIRISTGIKRALKIENGTFQALREANRYFLSDSEVDSLRTALENAWELSLEELQKLAMQGAYGSVNSGEEIPFTNIVDSLDNASQVREYLTAR